MLKLLKSLAKRNMTSDVAIIGMAGRFPGANSLEQYWENLCLGKESIKFFTNEELKLAGISEEILSHPDYVKAAPILDNIDLFDAKFFHYSPREAALLDPQQRLFLECAYETLESAGYPPYRGPQNIGVFCGAGGIVTSYLLACLEKDPNIKGSSGSVEHLANDKDFLATRISYKLNLKGPSISVQTACSTSLVSLHLACQSILRGECEMALAGSINIRVPHLAGYFRRKGDIFSVDGHCRPFDANAQGIIFGSGGGFILLKPLSQAIKDGDFIYAVLKSSAINNDGGHKISYMASSQVGQIECISNALRSAQINPKTITYIEAHGTGTTMGDPIEMSALTQVFNQPALEKQFCAVGSVKSNIGHLEMASGIASLIKTILALRHKKIPPAINFSAPNPKIDFKNSPFYVNTQLKEWDGWGNKKIRRAGVNSLGIGGTNAFAILEEAPVKNYLDNKQSKPYYLITLSATSQELLQQRIEQLLLWLDKFHQNYQLEDVSFTLNVGRDHFSERYAFVVDSIEQLHEALQSFQCKDVPPSETLSQEYINSLFQKITHEKINSHDYRIILGSFADFYRQRGELDWTLLHKNESQRRIPLPTYPYARERYWFPEVTTSLTSKNPVSQIQKLHPLLDEDLSNDKTTTFSKLLTGNEFYLVDHVIQGEKVLPGVIYLEMARAAAAIINHQHAAIELRDIIWMNPLLSKKETQALTINLNKNNNEVAFEIKSHELLHAKGKLFFNNVDEDDLPLKFLDIAAIKSQCNEILETNTIYELLNKQGIYCGPAFRSIRHVSYNNHELLAELLLPECVDKNHHFVLHPSLLDGAFEAVVGLLAGNKKFSTSPLLPFGLGELTAYAKLPPACYVHVKWANTNDEQIYYQFHLTITDKSGNILAVLRNYMIRPLAANGSAISRQESSTVPIMLDLNNEKSLVLNKLQEKLIDILANELEQDKGSVHLDEKLSTYDIDSIGFITLADELNKFYSLNLTPAILFEYDTLQKFSQYLLDNYYLAIKDFYQNDILQQTKSQEQNKILPEQRLNIRNRNFKANMEDIAVIGMSGIFPGSPDLSTFWNNLVIGADLIGEVPKERWDWEAYYGNPALQADKTKIKWGGFIADIDKFDASFFNISPREAELMDPQQRLFLQTVWKTIEDAGYSPEMLSATLTGLFVGVSTYDYSEILLKQGYSEVHATTGTMHSILANRVSYLLNLQGPSEAIDAACASSLIAVHHAVRALQNGDCEMAIAGGVNALLTPTLFISFDKAGMLSEDGRCKTFDKDANGYVRGEGAGAILLKPLSKAIDDKDHVYGIIKASVVNHGGHVHSLTVPNPNAQADVIIAAYQKANIPISTVGYIEAHGTGTSLGDPIEINGLKKAFSVLNHYEDNYKKPSCGLGTVKTNIGHLEAAAGIAGVIKLLLAMRHGKLPGIANFKQLNPYIQLENSPFYIVEKTCDWQRSRDEENQEVLRRGGVSSFGFGGSNAHIVFEEAPQKFATTKQQNKPYYLIGLSAKTSGSLQQKFHDLYSWLNTNLDATMEGIAYTLNTGRSHFKHRCAIVISSLSELSTSLEQILKGHKPEQCYFSNEEERKGSKNELATKLQTTQKELVKIDYSSADAYKENILTLGRLYAEGCELDWNLIHCEEANRKISLPTYPFSKESYWVQTLSPNALSSNEYLHPLIGWNSSSLGQTCFKSRFEGKEFYLAGHKIQNIKVLPGVVYLEMARAAGELALPGETCRLLKNVTWLRPLMSTNEVLEVTIILESRQENIVTYSINKEENGKQIICGQGELNFASKPILIDSEPFEVIESRLSKIFSREEIYHQFNQLGLTYGAPMQSLQWVKTNEQEALAYYCLPDVLAVESKKYLLHPSLVDGAFQTIFGLMLGQLGQLDSLQVPFTLDELKISDALSEKGYIYVCSAKNSKHSAASYDLQIYDEKKQVCVELNGLCARPVLNDSFQIERPQLEYYLPEWVDSQTSVESVEIKSICIFTNDSLMVNLLRKHFAEVPVFQIKIGDSYQEVMPDTYQVRLKEVSDYEELIKTINQAGYSFSHFLLISDDNKASEISNMGYINQEFYRTLTIIQSSLRLRVPGPLCFFNLYDSARLSTTYEMMLTAFAKSLQRENPQYQLKLLGVNIKAPDILIAQLKNEFLHPETANIHIKYNDNTRQVFSYKSVAKELVGIYSQEPSPLRKGGVYLITGGCGGLGFIVARYLAENYKSRLILTGRSAFDENKKKKIEFLNNLGAEVKYCPGDVTNLEMVSHWVSEAKQYFGILNGIIHCAGVLEDSWVFNKEWDAFERVLLPKVLGTINLDNATQTEALDCFILFSSIASCLGNVGQTDYASANAYLDAFAGWRQNKVTEGKRRGKTVSISWPLWAEGGMGLSEIIQKTLKKRLGLVKFPTQIGLETFEIALRQPYSHWIVAYGLLSQLRKDLSVNQTHLVKNVVTKQITEEVPINNNILYAKTLAFLQDTLANTLKQSSNKIGINTPFSDLGMDSILVIDLTHFLEKEFGLLPKTLFFEYQTLAELTKYFLQQHFEKLKEKFVKDSSLPLLQITTKETKSRVLPTDIKKNETLDPIAIIGISGRYPMADNLDQFWDNLKTGKDCVIEVPKERWDHQLYYDPEKNKLEKTYSKWGGFLNDFDKFDPLFFNISPREAELLDPQERLFLQVVWETLEDAGYTPDQLQIATAGHVGVFVGVMYGLYQLYGSTFNSSFASIANRVSYQLNLRGPSLAIDSMCSSSLTAIHLACESIRSGDCQLAFAGGVNITAHPNKYLLLSQGHFLASDGLCKSFGEGGDGYVPGEGVGAILLKKLSQAQNDGDQIYGIIRGSSINHGGKTNGYTVPNPVAQAELIQAAFKRAQIEPGSISYLEAHGTGTSLGDPIEMRGLCKAFENLLPVQSCPIGSVKSNIGHLESAAGIAALTKVLLQFKYKQLVPSIHSKTLNPYIDFSATPFYVQQNINNWNAVTGYPRRAGISSFGAGGSNAHLILEEPPLDQPETSTQVKPCYLVTLSAKHPQSLWQHVRNLTAWIKLHPEVSLARIAYTLNVRRVHFAHRYVVVARDLEDLQNKLAQSQEGVKIKNCFYGDASKEPDDVAIYQKVYKATLSELESHGFSDVTLYEENISALANLYVKGYEFNWMLLHKEDSGRKCSLPTYSFLKERYWVPELKLEPSKSLVTQKRPESYLPKINVEKNEQKPKEKILTFLQEILSQELKINVERININSGFEEFGIDSVNIIQLTNMLEKVYGKLPATLFFKYKNLNALAEYFLENHQEKINKQVNFTDQITENVTTVVKNKTVEQNQEMEIAIIGFSGQFPMADTVAEYWENLKNGRNCIVEIPKERWDASKYKDKMYCKWGGFINDVDKFDAAFFNVAPRDAKWFDPQERLFLQCVWSCLESAGYAKSQLASRVFSDPKLRVGVFAGAGFNNYQLVSAEAMRQGLDDVVISSQIFSIANRVSYYFDFKGPSLTIDTACSSSLYAVHLACESIRRNECTLAIAGGVNLTLHPSKYLTLCATQFAASDGLCHPFGEGGDGYVPGEAVGAVLLKPLSLAINDGDQIYAVLKATAVSHDGKTHGYTVPNPVAQSEVIQLAFEKAKVDPRTITYLEAHGTGTSLGDPIEITGLNDVYKVRNTDKQYCAIGSVKSNIGHSEAAAGIAQLIKVILQIKNKQLTPTLLHGRSVNPHIDFKNSPFYVQKELTEWQQPKFTENGHEMTIPRRAGISSFGAGGVNVHAIVEEYISDKDEVIASLTTTTNPKNFNVVIPLSAKTEKQLQTNAKSLKNFLQQYKNHNPITGHSINFLDLAYTLQVCKEAMPFRLAFVASTLQEVIDKLDEYLNKNIYCGKAENGFNEELSLVHTPEELANFWIRGATLAWEKLYDFTGKKCIYLPTYSFVKDRHWIIGSEQYTVINSEDSLPISEQKLTVNNEVEIVDHQFLKDLSEMSEIDQREGVVNYCQGLLAKILEYNSPDLLNTEQGFFELGMESLQAIDFQKLLERHLKVKMSDTALFDYPTIEKLANYLLQLISFDNLKIPTELPKALMHNDDLALLSEAALPDDLIAMTKEQVAVALDSVTYRLDAD